MVAIFVRKPIGVKSAFVGLSLCFGYIFTNCFLIRILVFEKLGYIKTIKLQHKPAIQFAKSREKKHRLGCLQTPDNCALRTETETRSTNSKRNLARPFSRQEQRGKLDQVALKHPITAPQDPRQKIEARILEDLTRPLFLHYVTILCFTLDLLRKKKERERLLAVYEAINIEIMEA